MASTDALFYSDVKGRAASADYDFALVWAAVLLLALGVGFALCFWQHSKIIDFLNRPLPSSMPAPIVVVPL